MKPIEAIIGATFCLGIILMTVSCSIATPQKVVAACLVLEAASEGETGMKAVASVILNRSRAQGVSPNGIVTQVGQFVTMDRGAERAVIIAEHDPKFKKAWPVALVIAEDVLRGTLKDTTDGALYFKSVNGKNIFK